jgi:broad specificity polyphosphatase/5'/3'-nucleotidase SurE
MGDHGNENVDLPDFSLEDTLSTTLMWLCPYNHTTHIEENSINTSTSFHWIELMQGRQEVSTFMEQSAHFTHMLVQMTPIQVEIPGPRSTLRIFSGFFRLQVNPISEQMDDY